MKLFLERSGYEVETAATGEDGLARLEKFKPDFVLVDYQLPKMNGLELLERVRGQDRRIKTIMITGQGNVEVAVKAMKAGAFDYLSKPLALSELKLLLGRAVDEGRREGTLAYYQKREASASGMVKLIGDSPPMRVLKESIEQLIEAERRLTMGDPPAVLITGETGTGKELVARAIHYDGPRKDLPFMEINCASIPVQLLEAELFGYERGAFTDAKERKQGLVESAEGGTLFLDEIGELDSATQAKLLKLLEEKLVRRLGGLREQKVNVRVVAATNQNLERMVQEGKFRPDLFFRLRIFHVQLPPLRARGEDILMLARDFLGQQGARYGKPGLRFTAEAEETLLRYSWPGNVRELRNTLEQTVLLSRGTVIEAGQIAFCRTLSSPASGGSALPAPEDVLRLPESGLNMEQVERTLLSQALENTGWNVTRAARLLGLTRDTLRYRMEKYSFKSPA
jgi:two-component system, NtrC family, response regulator AtoC